MNISKEALATIRQERDEANNRAEGMSMAVNALATERDELKAELSAAQRAQEGFRAVLDDIVSAAQGFPIVGGLKEPENVYRNFGSSYPHEVAPCVVHPPSEEQRHADQVRVLNTQIIDLERRLAGVIAVASFVRAHE